MALIAILSIIALLLACTPKLNTTMQSWVGKPEAQLLASWGAPTNREVLDGGVKVYTWVDVWYWRGQQHTCRKTFTIANGEVQQWSYADCQKGLL
jgi:hypothetical protein